jgi:alpha-glucosidase (family GH31 glycosyl hydrolase)
VAATFREKKIPCDVVWMDIDYMEGFKCFTFDKVCVHDSFLVYKGEVTKKCK